MSVDTQADSEVGGTASLSRKVQLAAVWSAPAFLVIYSIGFCGIARFLPPPAPELSAAQIGGLFVDHDLRIRVGLIVGLSAAALLFPFFASISSQIAKIEGGRYPLLAHVQFGGAILLIVFFAICHMLWIAATYRSDLDPSAIRMLNDLAWLMFVMVFPGYVLQMACIALASFIDTRATPVFPRWLGYLCAWNGTAAFGGAAAVFFKDGPLAWNGVVALWIPLTMFGVWLMAMTWALHRAVTREHPRVDVDEPDFL